MKMNTKESIDNLAVFIRDSAEAQNAANDFMHNASNIEAKKTGKAVTPKTLSGSSLVPCDKILDANDRKSINETEKLIRDTALSKDKVRNSEYGTAKIKRKRAEKTPRTSSDLSSVKSNKKINLIDDPVTTHIIVDIKNCTMINIIIIIILASDFEYNANNLEHGCAGKK